MFSVLRKIAKITAKVIIFIIIGAFGLYLFISYAAIPIGLPWLVKAQGKKLLARTVTLEGARFNPFTLRLSLRGFKLLDTDKKEMAGFKKLWVDVSFLKLLKKQYRIESVGIGGLNVNVVLLPENQVNLLSLMPKEAQAPAKTGQPLSTEAPSQQQAQGSTATAPLNPLPDIVIDEIVLKDGAVTFSDGSIGVGFNTRLSPIQMNITGVSTKPDCRVKLVFSSNIDDKGKIRTEALLKPFVKPLEMEASFSLNDYAIRALTPYVGKYTGRAVKEGSKLDVRIDYRIADNKLNAGHKVLVQQFNFGEKVESKDALALPFGLAVALLEDPRGRIDVSLPVHGDISDPKFEYFHLLGQVAANFFMKLVTAPFKVLLALVPAGEQGVEELGTVSFAPGAAVLSDADKQKLELLAKAMKDRPKLLLEINGSYDNEVDWKAIKTQAFEDQYAAMREESAFEDFRLYENMYKFEFGVRAYWALARQHTVKGKVDEGTLKTEIRRLIIEKGAPDKKALEGLAQKRGQAVYDALMAAGIDASRAKLGAVRATQASMGLVPMEFTLTVFENE